MNPALATGLQIDIGPFLVRVRSELASLDQHLQRLYGDFPMRPADWGHFDVAVLGGRGMRRWVRPQAKVAVNGMQPFFPLSAQLAGPMMEWGLNWCIGRHTHRWIPIHAAAVERNGKVLILSAVSGAGKSTLCTELVLSGWRLFSDEFALIDPKTGAVSPTPRPISLKEGSIEITRRRHPEVVLTPERIDVDGRRFCHAKPPTESVRRAHETARPGWVILPRYVPGSATLIEAVPKAHALMALAEQSFNYNFLGPRGYDALVELIRESDCYRLEYSDLDDVRARLVALTTV